MSYLKSNAILNPFYFYHLLPKKIKLDDKGLLTLEYMYNHNMIQEFREYTNKYRDRICNGWDYFPNKSPLSLTDEEIIYALKKYRGKDGLNCIYFFKYPPYKSLGKNMRYVLENKQCYSIDINDKESKKYIKSIDWGYYHSNSDNKKLNRKYYDHITIEEYFKDYDDNIQMIFSRLNHISIVPKDGYLPLHILNKISMR